MADLQIREKVKKISAAAKNGESIPAKSKRAGLIVFLLLFGIAIIVLFALSIGLFINKQFTTATIVLIISSLLTYSIIKMMTADNLEEL